MQSTEAVSTHGSTYFEQQQSRCCQHRGAALSRRMLSANFNAMVDLGDDVLKPFLQVTHPTAPSMRCRYSLPWYCTHLPTVAIIPLDDAVAHHEVSTLDRPAWHVRIGMKCTCCTTCQFQLLLPVHQLFHAAVW